jgi:hypothetical protein
MTAPAVNLTADLTDFEPLKWKEIGIHTTRHSLNYKNKELESVYRRLSASYESRAFLVVAVPKSDSAASLRNE